MMHNYHITDEYADFADDYDKFGIFSEVSKKRAISSKPSSKHIMFTRFLIVHAVLVRIFMHLHRWAFMSVEAIFHQQC